MLFISGAGCIAGDDLSDTGTLSIVHYRKGKEMSFKTKQEKCCNYSAKAKLIKKVEFEVCDDNLSKSERKIYLSMYECTECHWRYYADIVRFGFGYDAEYKNKPNFCPGCGSKIYD